MAQEQLNWVRGNLLVKAGLEINHNRDATTRLRNQAGTYTYSSVENFASDALAFSTYGLNAQLNPDEPAQLRSDRESLARFFRCAPRSRLPAVLLVLLADHGPCGLVAQHQRLGRIRNLAMATVKTNRLQSCHALGTRTAPACDLRSHNPDLPLTTRMPNLGSQWGPRAGFAWGTGEGHWPVVRLGYGVYFSRTRNSVVENALTQTGSLKGDLNFFMRPTDNLNAGGAPPFPYVLAGEPANIVKPAAVEFAPNFRNGEIQQAEATVEETLPEKIHLEASAVASLGRRLPITLDANIDPAMDAKTITYAVVDGNASGPIKSSLITVPFFASWPSIASPTGFAGRLNPNYQQVSEIFKSGKLHV